MGNISITLVEVARSVVEECVGINRFERTTTIAIKLQPAWCPYHIASIEGVTKPRKHKKENPRVGNQELQLPKWITRSPQMPYWNW